MQPKTVKRLASIILAVGMLQGVNANAGLMNFFFGNLRGMDAGPDTVYNIKCTPSNSPTGKCIPEIKPPAGLNDAQRAAWDAANPDYSRSDLIWNPTTGKYDPDIPRQVEDSNPIIPPTTESGAATAPPGSNGNPAATNYSAYGATSPASSAYVPQAGGPNKPPCGPTSSINDARANAIAGEKQKLKDTQSAAEAQAEADTSCQINVNSDLIKNAIPNVLNGISSLVSAFDPAALVSQAGGALAGLAARAAATNACQLSKNVLSGATRAVGNIAGQAVNNNVGKALAPISNQINGVNNQIYGYTGQANQIQSNVPGGPYVSAPTITNPTYGAQNTAQKSTSGVFNSVSCRLFGQGC